MISISRLIDIKSQENPHKIAIRYSGEAITYRALETRSNQIASLLNANNLGTGDVIAIAMDRSIDMVVSLLAIIKSGAAYLPIDINLPIDRVNFLIKDSSAKTLLTLEKYSDFYKALPALLIFDKISQQLSNYPTESINKDLAENLAYIRYTSGSTGLPKGVAVEHHNLVNFFSSMREAPGITADDVMLGLTVISFDISELELFLPLINGAQLVIVDIDIAKDGRELLEFIKQQNITIMQATPFTWRIMLEYEWQDHLPVKALCGGEALDKDLAEKLTAQCDELWNMYGPTETTIWSAIKKIEPEDDVITIGKPIANTQIYILDENLSQVANGEIGEIYIGGDGVARGYINRPELTIERFVADRFQPGSDRKIYRTGDLGRIINNGDIECLGRIDHQIKIRGYRIETSEIEYQLKLQKKIKDAYVISYKDSVDNVRLVAYITSKASLSEADIKKCKDRLAKVLPDYMVPNDYVVIPSIPLNSNGKVDRKALPNPELGHNVTEYLAPATDLEKTISEIWTKSIGISHIGVNDNFFSLGGNSLLAAKTMVQIEKLTGNRLSLANLFKYPTIRTLASIIDAPSFNPYNSLIAIKPRGTKIPLYIVHGIGLNLLNFRGMVFNLDNDQPVYGLQSLGLNNESEVLDTIEETAAAYNSEILMHNPDGPYAIAGYSFGGFIAFEMVKQLRAAGKDVRLFAMFDTNLQSSDTNLPPLKRTLKKFIRQFPKIVFRIKSFIELPKENITYLKYFYGQKLKGLYKPVDFQDERSAEDLPGYMQKIADKLVEAFYNYKITPQDVKLDLFKAQKKLYYLDDSKYLGWKKYILGGINIHIVPGDHKDMFNPPNDAILAGILQKRLNEINK